MNPDHLWEDRDAIVSLAALCADPRASEAIRHISTADEAREIAATWHRHLSARNQPAATYWKTHQTDCQALACYHLQILAEIIGWNPEQTNTEPTLES
jgi:hypothetical protein